MEQIKAALDAAEGAEVADAVAGLKELQQSRQEFGIPMGVKQIFGECKPLFRPVVEAVRSAVSVELSPLASGMLSKHHSDGAAVARDANRFHGRKEDVLFLPAVALVGKCAQEVCDVVKVIRFYDLFVFNFRHHLGRPKAHL